MKKQSILRRVFAVLLSALLVLCSFSACRGSGGGENIYWLLDSSIRNLDPQTAADESELLIIKNCFAPLFEKD